MREVKRTAEFAFEASEDDMRITLEELRDGLSELITESAKNGDLEIEDIEADGNTLRIEAVSSDKL